MAKKNKHVIAITLGDINGVGPEVVMKTLADERILNHVIPVIFGSSATIAHYRKLLKLDDFSFIHLREGQEPNPKRINLVECWEDTAEVTPGKESKEAGEKAFKALEKASEFMEKGLVDAIVTAPINKATIQSDSFNFPGHTEYFGARFDGDPLMFMISGSLRRTVAAKQMLLQAWQKIKHSTCGILHYPKKIVIC